MSELPTNRTWRPPAVPRLLAGLATAGLLLAAAQPPLRAAVPEGQVERVEGSLDSDLVPSPVSYLALLPPGYDAQGPALPLVLNLHGGGGSSELLAREQPWFEGMWRAGDLPPMVIVTPSVTPRGFYLDRRDGAERWESFLTGPFLEHLRQRFRVRTDRRGTLITGISMGGMGSLRLAFKHPDLFGAVAGMEPGIEPVLEWSEIRPKHRFWRSDDLMLDAYGYAEGGERKIDEAFFAANNPATIADHEAQRLRDSGLKILIEAGDQDMFWLYEGTEFLHQVLYRQRIRHEYRLYYGADHVGASVRERTRQAYLFLAGTLSDPQPDAQVSASRARIDPLKRRLTEADHYGNDRDLIRPSEDGRP